MAAPDSLPSRPAFTRALEQFAKQTARERRGAHCVAFDIQPAIQALTVPERGGALALTA